MSQYSDSNTPLKQPVLGPRMRLGLKVLATTAILAFILFHIPLEESFMVLAQSNLGFAALAVMLFMARTLFAGARWRLLLDYRGCQLGLVQAVSLYLRGTFVGSFFPSGVGVDIYRGVSLARKMSGATITGSILMERFMGYIALLILCAVGFSLWGGDGSRLQHGAALILGCGLGAVVLLIVFCEPVFKRFKSGWLGRIAKNILRMRAELSSYNQPVLLMKTMVLSLCFQSAGIVSVWLCALAVSGDSSLALYFMLVPLVWVISMLPVTLGGIGVQEGAFIYLFKTAGVQIEIVSAVAILWLLVRYSGILLGGLAFFLPLSVAEDKK